MCLVFDNQTNAIRLVCRMHSLCELHCALKRVKRVCGVIKQIVLSIAVPHIAVDVHLHLCAVKGDDPIVMSSTQKSILSLSLFSATWSRC